MKLQQTVAIVFLVVWALCIISLLTNLTQIKKLRLFIVYLSICYYSRLQLYSLHLSHANITHFDYGALNTWHLRSLKLSYNQLREIDFRSPTFAENSITELNLQGNELEEIRNLHRHNFPRLRSLSLARNQLPCTRLIHIIREWNGKFSDDPWDQKHDRDCYELNQLYSNPDAMLVAAEAETKRHKRKNL